MITDVGPIFCLHLCSCLVLQFDYTTKKIIYTNLVITYRSCVICDNITIITDPQSDKSPKPFKDEGVIWRAGICHRGDNGQPDGKILWSGASCYGEGGGKKFWWRQREGACRRFV